MDYNLLLECRPVKMLVNTQTCEIEQGLLVVKPSNGGCSLGSLDALEITEQYKQFGALLFRGFDYTIDEFKLFTDQFCSNYVSNRSPGRDLLSDDGRVQTVNLGEKHFSLHPEIAREPWQPDIAWFACQSPSNVGGETIVCDGVAAVEQFSTELIELMQNNCLSHALPTDLGWASQFLQDPTLTLSKLLESGCLSGFKFSIVNGQLIRTYERPMLHKPMFDDRWAYGSFLVFARRNLGISNFPTYLSGAKIEDEWVDEIESATRKVSVEIKWREKDLIMLDNTRFMHGRNPIGDPQNRKILTQFGYVSFVPQDYPNLEQQIWRS